MKIVSKKSGFGLLEVVIAAGIIAIFAGGVVLLSVGSLRSSVINKHRTQAAAIAQEGMEGIRVIRDSAWVDKSSTTDWQTNIQLTPTGQSDKVYYDTASDFQWKVANNFQFNIDQCTPAAEEGKSWFRLNNVCFGRSVKIESGPAEISNYNGSENLTSRKVTVTVAWKDYGRYREVKVETILTNWRAY